MPLAPEVQALLEREAASGLPPRSRRTIKETREIYLQARAASGTPVALPDVRDLDAGGVPVRLYTPQLDSSLPLLVYFHGGRFISGNLETHDPVCRSLAAESGCIVAAVDYRLAPEHRFPAALEDCYAALAWLAGRFGCGRAGVGGDSAGGNLAAAAALLARDRGGPPLACQMLIYPMLDATCSLASHRDYASGYGPGSADMKRGWDEYLSPDADPRDPRVSPLWAADLGGLPRAFVLTAEYDSLRDEAEAYAHGLREAGVPLTLTRYEGAIHGIFQMAGVLESGRRAVHEAAAWVREALLLP